MPNLANAKWRGAANESPRGQPISYYVLFKLSPGLPGCQVASCWATAVASKTKSSQPHRAPGRS
eukprot:1986156-Prymnesium_polylepis.1